VRVPREKWRVLLHDRHEGYIDWDEFERNLCVIANNTNRMGQAVQGAVRGGAALLAGLLRAVTVDASSKSVTERIYPQTNQTV
jgi:hypothetical protein